MSSSVAEASGVGAKKDTRPRKTGEVHSRFWFTVKPMLPGGGQVLVFSKWCLMDWILLKKLNLYTCLTPHRGDGRWWKFLEDDRAESGGI